MQCGGVSGDPKRTGLPRTCEHHLTWKRVFAGANMKCMVGAESKDRSPCKRKEGKV